MSEIPIYEAQTLTPEYYKIFSGIYNDFVEKAVPEYKFELPPIDLKSFLHCIDTKILECLVLLEDNVPTGFLIYTTLISETIELNIIHCLGDTDITHKSMILLEKFLELTTDLRKTKVVTYPMLGPQRDFARDIKNYGFGVVNQSVVRFHLNSPTCLQIFKGLKLKELDENYKIVNWDNLYINSAISIINEAFSSSSDRFFDTRFLSRDGCFDIVGKIIKSTYGKFLPQCTKVLLYNSKPVGICFANLTSDVIANIPIICIESAHRFKGLSEKLLQAATQSVLDLVIQGRVNLTELNACCDADNFSAVKMYRKVGFREDYRYPQTYLNPET